MSSQEIFFVLIPAILLMFGACYNTCNNRIAPIIHRLRTGQ